MPHFDGKGEADKIFRELEVPTTFLLTSFYWDNFIHFGMCPKKGADGKLAGIQLDGNPIESFPALHEAIIDRIGVDATDAIKESAEVELDCDYGLHYRHVIEAITACSGYISPDGNIVKLIEKIRFAPPKR